MRTARDDPRQRLLRVVEEHPGCHLRALERLVPYSFGSLRHHLDQLAAAGLIRAELDQRFLRYYPIAMDAALRKTCAAMRQRQLRRMMVYLLDHDIATRTEIARALELPLSTVATYVRRLRAMDVLKELEPQHGLSLRDKQRTEAALIKYRPTLLDAFIDGALRLFEQS
jgi:predicted transcriptional regulator